MKMSRWRMWVGEKSAEGPVMIALRGRVGWGTEVGVESQGYVRSLHHRSFRHSYLKRTARNPGSSETPGSESLNEKETQRPEFLNSSWGFQGLLELWVQSPGQNLWKSLGVRLQGIRERKGADQEGKTEVVFILNRAKGAEDQGLRRMRASAQLPGPQTMGWDRTVDCMLWVCVPENVKEQKRNVSLPFWKSLLKVLQIYRI